GTWDTLLPSFQKVARTRDIFRYLETYGKVLLIPEIGAFGNTLYIKRHNNGSYTVTQGAAIKEYSELPLRNKLNERMEKDHFIVQPDLGAATADGQPFSICTHLMLKSEDTWQFVSPYAEIRADTTKESFQEELMTFLKQQYGETAAARLDNSIKDLSKKAAA